MVCVLSDEIDMTYRFGQHMFMINLSNSVCIYCYMNIVRLSLVYVQ
jgi:hypothetical protein